MCFNSVLIPPVNRGPPDFFFSLNASKLHILCKFWGAVCGNQLQFWNRILIHLCIILNKSIVVNIFFLARDRSLKLNTSFPVSYFDEVLMYNVLNLNSRRSGIQTDLCPFIKVRRSMCLLLPWPSISIHSEMSDTGRAICAPPLPLSKVGRGTCPLLPPILAGML